MAVLKALNAYDILQETTRLPEADRERLLPRSQQEAGEAFAALEESLDWPRIRVEVGVQDFELQSLPKLDLHREIPQPILLTLHNPTSEARRLSLRSSGLRMEVDSVEVAPSATRHLLAHFDSPETGEGAASLAVASEEKSVAWRLPVRIGETGLLEGRLAESESGAPTIGRIRATDAEGRYRPPLEAGYGLILRPRKDARPLELCLRNLPPASPGRQGPDFLPARHGILAYRRGVAA